MTSNNRIVIKAKKGSLFCFLVSLVFKESKDPEVFITWGDTVYTDLKDIPIDLVHHETIHTVQQRQSKLFGLYWWAKYILSKRFRFSQEVEAYRGQYEFAVKHYKMDRNKSSWALKKVASAISSKLYGNMVEFSDALKLIKSK